MAGVDRFQLGEFIEASFHLLDQLVEQATAIRGAHGGPFWKSFAGGGHRAIDIGCACFSDFEQHGIIERVSHWDASALDSFHPLPADQQLTWELSEIDGF